MKNTYKSVLGSLMKECDIDDIQLSKHTGVPISTITRTRLAKNSNPTASTLKPLSDFFKVSIDALLGREELPKDRIPGFHQRDKYTTSILPVIKWQDMNSYITNIHSFNESKFLKWVSSEKNTSEGSFAVFIPNGELALFLKKGSTVLIDKSSQVISGDISLIRISERTVALKKILIDGDKLYMKSITPGINTIEPLKDHSQVIGKVIEMRYPLQEELESSETSMSTSRNQEHVVYPTPIKST
jgi:SOS-response transcriptional repressor LexA